MQPSLNLNLNLEVVDGSVAVSQLIVLSITYKTAKSELCVHNSRPYDVGKYLLLLLISSSAQYVQGSNLV